MRKIIIFLFLFVLSFQVGYSAESVDNSQACNLKVFSEKNKWGLKSGDKVVVKSVYNKMVPLGVNNNSWIVMKGYRYGLLSKDGSYLIKPKYRNVDRYFKKYVKLGNDNNFGLYDEYGKVIIKPVYSQISPLYGKMFKTCKNYKYGIVDIEGNVILDNEFDDIYMPKPDVLMLQYEGRWCVIEQLNESEISLPANLNQVDISKEFKITNFMVNTGVVSGYSVLTLTDYILKIFSSMSGAYESTIDELMFSKGAETITVITRLTWIPMFPIVYLKNYYKQLRTPNSGPLNSARNSVLNQMR